MVIKVQAMVSIKLVLGIMVIAAVVESRWPCKKAKKKLDKCRSNGYVIGDCEVGDGDLTDKQRKKCGKLYKKYEASCDAYECRAAESG